MSEKQQQQQPINKFNKSNNIIATMKLLQSAYERIYTEKIIGQKDVSIIKEIDWLKEQCTVSSSSKSLHGTDDDTNNNNNSIQLNLLSCQTFIRLVDDDILNGTEILTMFIAMLSNAGNTSHYTAICEGIIGLLLLDLRKCTILMKSNEKYICPYGLIPPEHPLIFLLNTKGVHLNDLAIKINGICTHHDKQIKKNSIEFLRPVFLYALCNPNPTIGDSKTIWTCLLSQFQQNSTEAEHLIMEILCWRKITSSSSCLFTSILLNEVIDVLLLNFMVKRKELILNLTIYLMSILSDFIEYGYDPQPILNLILRVLYKFEQINSLCYNILLIMLAKCLHILSPSYIPDIVGLLKFIIVTRNAGNSITLNMIVDGFLIWLSNSFFITSETLHDIEYLIEYITMKIYDDPQSQQPVKPVEHFDVHMKYFHSNIAITMGLAKLSMEFHLNILSNQFDSIENFLLNLSKSSSSSSQSSTIKNNNLTYIRFCYHIQLFLRGIFLCRYITKQSIQSMVFKLLLNIIQLDDAIATDLLYTVLYKLSMETDANGQLDLLQGLPAFAIVKDNVPIILRTLHALTTATTTATSTNSLKPFALDLFLRLWKIESRTYPFLYKQLTQLNDCDDVEVPTAAAVAAVQSKNNKRQLKNNWEMNVTKAFTIHEICKLKGEQYGTDLVTQLSNILNQCSTTNTNGGDLATAIALDTIIILCNSNIVNITSTWQAIGGRFRNEKRTRAIQSLCKFFGQVPLLRNPTMEYEQLFTDAYAKLWHYVVMSDRKVIIGSALAALKNYKLDDIELKNIPDIFRENIQLPSEYSKTPQDANRNPIDVLPYVPGECWLQLLQKVNASACDDAIDLISHYIHCEIAGYRGGIYMLPEGRPEPVNYPQLHRRSPLRAIVQYLYSETTGKKTIKDSSSSLIVNCLKCISKRFPKPMPPFNWFFLVEYLNNNTTTTTTATAADELTTVLCLKIGVNQILQWGSAKNLIENYINGDVDKWSIDNCGQLSDYLIENLLELLPDLAVAIECSKLKEFSENLIQYTFERSKGTQFESNCLFEMALNQLRMIFMMVDNKSTTTTTSASASSSITKDNLEMFSIIYEKYMNLLDINNKIFKLYANIACLLPVSILDAMTSPNTWWEIQTEKLKKAMIIRCALVLNNHENPRNSIENPLYWLNPIIDNVEKNTVTHQFILRKIIDVLLEFGGQNDKYTSLWLMDILSEIQGLLTESINKIDCVTTKDSQIKCQFLLDLFIMSFGILSGYGLLYSNVQTLAESQQSRLNCFPQSLRMISERGEYWKNCIGRIHEFLYYHYLNSTSSLPSHILNVFKDTLLCSKDYIIQKGDWIKYIGLRINK